MDANLVNGLKGIAVANNGIRVAQSIAEANQVPQRPFIIRQLDVCRGSPW